MSELQVDVAVANRFISSLSKSLQALCHGCMDFDSGIEIVGYININIDCGSKVDYVLNEKVLKSTTNSMTFVSNSFLAKKDTPKQTRDGACSPIPELRPQHQTPYYRGAYQGPRSSMHFGQSHSYHGSQKRAWPGTERDWRMSPKKYRGGRMGHHPSYTTASTSLNTTHAPSPLPVSQTADADFKIPMSSEGNPLSNTAQSAVNVKKEVMDSDNTQQSELDQTSTEQSGEESLQTSQMNIKKDPDAESIQNPPETQTDQTNESTSCDASDSDFKGTFLHPGSDPSNTENNGDVGTSDGSALESTEQTVDPANQNSSLLPEQGDGSNISGEYGATNDNFPESVPSGSGEFGETVGDESYSQSAYSDAGEGSNDGGQFEVIEIEDEDEDMQGLFGDTRENDKAIRKRRYRRALKTAKRMQRKMSQRATSESRDWSGTNKQRGSVEICSFCRIALPMGTTYQQHFDEVHMLDRGDSDLMNPYPYTCEICQKTFVTKERLRQHSKVHDTVLYSCFVCDVKFKHKKNIKRHIETTHGLKKCSSCMALFTKGEQFDSHVLTCINFEKGDIQLQEAFESLQTY
ncbi:zinc finger and BTB domain-containing protein 14 [Elysia marginata]|uniref:Zinc finger and BTB domain-containing protein 14 n=1 Tax=Elysia marginata TaxID=1093978 RepID=A0AAV4HNX4_9GAST|nr:zinc finger and BTB domain-containing protein 14 [Elysia marginata]